MKKIFIFLLLLTGLFTAQAQQPVSFSVQADADDWQLYMSSRLMEDFNSNGKVVFITLTAGDEGNAATTFNGSAIPYYVAREKGGVYAAKFACDISVNGTPCTIETVPAQQVTLINGHSLVKYVYKNSVSYFLRLPDGGFSGDGFAATGMKSLEKLETGAIPSLTSVDGANTYNGWEDLTTTILDIITLEKSNANLVWLHTGSIDETVNPNDNSDHIHAAMAAKDATSYLSYVGYVEYVNDHSATLANNLPVLKFQDAAGLFGAADYALVENKYATKLTTANIALMQMDYYTVNRNPSNCDKTDNLTVGSITSSSAVLSWKKIIGSVGYEVDYKTGLGSWVSAGEAIIDSFVNVTGLSASTAYQWRVRTKCLANGNGSGFTQGQFTTAVSVTCNAPTGLSTTNITANSAKLNWVAVSGGVSYVVELKTNAATAWTTVATASTAISYTASGLTPGTIYQWRIKTNCAAGITSATYTQAQFTTPDLCADILEYNNTFYYAKAITPGLNYSAQISSCNDKDYYKFNNTSTAKNIRITLTNLPYDYDVKLYNNCGQLVGKSENWGTNSETIVFNSYYSSAVGTYRVYVYGYNGANSNTKCYTLKVEISSTPFVQNNYCAPAPGMAAPAGKIDGDGDISDELIEEAIAPLDKVQTSGNLSVTDVKVFPVPAYGETTLSFEGDKPGNALVTIVANTGREVQRQIIAVNPGHNTIKLNLLSLTSGVYTVIVKYAGGSQTKKLVIAR